MVKAKKIKANDNDGLRRYDTEIPAINEIQIYNRGRL